MTETQSEVEQPPAQPEPPSHQPTAYNEAGTPTAWEMSQQEIDMGVLNPPDTYPPDPVVPASGGDNLPAAPIPPGAAVPPAETEGGLVSPPPDPLAPADLPPNLPEDELEERRARLAMARGEVPVEDVPPSAVEQPPAPPPSDVEQPPAQP